MDRNYKDVKQFIELIIRRSTKDPDDSNIYLCDETTKRAAEKALRSLENTWNSDKCDHNLMKSGGYPNGLYVEWCSNCFKVLEGPIMGG